MASKTLFAPIVFFLLISCMITVVLYSFRVVKMSLMELNFLISTVSRFIFGLKTSSTAICPAHRHTDAASNKSVEEYPMYKSVVAMLRDNFSTSSF